MKKVAVIGTGRVGLPLALSLIEAGMEVVGIDTNDQIRYFINELRRMPFFEPGYEGLIQEGRFKVRSDYSIVQDVDYIIITVGTPLLPHIESDLSAIESALFSIGKFLRDGQTLILRSTVAPGTSDWVCEMLATAFHREVGHDIFFAYCPERIVEGKAKVELKMLPQIVGSRDNHSARKAEELFKTLGVEVLHCNFVMAELAKLFTNISRYINFSIANYLAQVALEYDVDFYELAKLVNYKYPRPIHSFAGLTGGTCLRKDFGMISENCSGVDLGIVAWRINETMPVKLIQAVKRRWGSLTGKKCAVLGYTYKRDSDDIRDSLAPKLVRYLLREGCLVSVTDPYVDENCIPKRPGIVFKRSLEDVLADADIVWIATNHTLYKERKSLILETVKKGCLIVDIWNVLGIDRMFIRNNGQGGSK